MNHSLELFLRKALFEWTMFSRVARSVVVFGKPEIWSVPRSCRSIAIVASKRIVSNHPAVTQLTSRFSVQKADGKEPAAAAGESSAPKSSAVAKYDFDEYDDYEEPKTAGEKVFFCT